MIEQQVARVDVLEERVLEVIARCRASCLFRRSSATRLCRCTRCVGARTAYVASQRGREAPAGRCCRRPDEAVLEIGAGSGFVTACLRAMAAQVRSLEIFPELADAARRHLAALGMRDVEVLDRGCAQLDSGARYGAIR